MEYKKYWKKYNAYEFQEKVKEDPLCGKNLWKVLLQNLIEVRYSNHKSGQAFTLFLGLYSVFNEKLNLEERVPRFIIGISKNQSLEMQGLCLAHEFVHIYYGSNGSYKIKSDEETIEKLVEDEAKKIMREYPEFIKRVLLMLIEETELRDYN